MVHSEFSERKKRKPRGRPFTSDNNPSKFKSNVLASSRHERRDGGEFIDDSNMGCAKQGETMTARLTTLEVNPIEVMTTETPLDFSDKEKSVLEEKLVDQIEFRNGSNVLKIVFKKKHNRMFRIQIFMNDTTEVRPVTYTGSVTANSFWNLLKNSLKK